MGNSTYSTPRKSYDDKKGESPEPTNASTTKNRDHESDKKRK